MDIPYNNDLVNLTLLKCKDSASRRDKQAIGRIEAKYPDWGVEYPKILDWLAFRGYVDKIDINPDLPYQEPSGAVIRYKVGEKFNYKILDKGLSALNKKAFPSILEKERESSIDKWITRIVAIAGVILAILSILMQKCS